MKYMTAKIIRPVTIHGGEIVDVDELIKELNVQKRINSSQGMYVYAAGHDWPESSAERIIHTWHKADKTLDYLRRWKLETGERWGKVVFTGTGYYLEKIEK